MPPRIPVRFPWASRTFIASPNGFLTSSCMRTFSSTNPSLALGPESPNYIEVPKPLQPTFPLRPQSKGHLPVPRDVFKTRSRTPKESEVFIKRASRSPKKENIKMPGPYSKDADYRLYKQRLADTRRRALNEGVTELYGRKVTMEADHQAKIQRNNADRKARAMAPPRPVDVLTQTSVSKGIRDFLDDKLPKIPRETVVRSRQRAYARRLTKQDDVRRERLHDLYTNAREFIVDEQQLDDAIEKAFGSEDQPVRWDNRGAISPNATGLSPWDGPMPEGVGDKLQKLKGGEGVGLAKERVKKVAEALTGGKM